LALDLVLDDDNNAEFIIANFYNKL